MTLQAIGINGRDEFTELGDDHTLALAQLCKRITWSDLTSTATDAG